MLAVTITVPIMVAASAVAIPDYATPAGEQGDEG